jgi:hypothetical protein
MALSEDDERRIEGEVAGMVAELRNRPSQEKEDRIGVEISLLPEEERAFVPVILLRFLAAERRGEPLPDALPSSVTVPRRPSRRFGWSLRLPRG